MRRALPLLCLLVLTSAPACYGDTPDDSEFTTDTGDETPDETPDETGDEVPGIMYFESELADGNSFACTTCHATAEPPVDGIRRVGHQLGDATRRSTYKNGQLTEMLDAVNSCLEEWMNAPPWTAESPEWLALYDYLDGMAPEGEAEAVTFTVVEPPADLTGGDAEAGQELFNESCTMCHGMDAAGTLRGPPLAGAGLPATYVAQRVRTSGSGESPIYDGLTGGIMPFWGADRLTDDEVRDLAAFVETSEVVEPGDGIGTGGGDTGDDTGGDDTGGADTGGGCDATHPHVGWTTELSTLFHMVSGTATIVDDCTIVVEDFHFDGNGIEVRWWGQVDGSYKPGMSLSEDLYNFPVGFVGTTQTISLPDGVTFDDIEGVSVWCVAVGVSFGDGVFAAP